VSGRDPIWVPSQERLARARVTGFMRFVNGRDGLALGGYEDLWRWSTEDVERFWETIWQYYEPLSDQPYEEVMSTHEMPGCSWFSGARVNWAEQVFRDRDPDAVAVISESESRPDRRRLTFGRLAGEVGAMAAALRAAGVEEGDRVVAYLPNIPETLIAALAAISIGAVWSSAAPEFGARSVIDRMAQIEPKVLLTIDGYRYSGRDFDRRDEARAIVAGLPTLERVVLLPYLCADARLEEVADCVLWDDFVADHQGAPLRFNRVAASAPLWVLFSSGTTGLPKAIVHSHVGILVEQLKSHHLHFDLRPGDRVFWFTTTGWMMWNLLMGSLMTGAAVVMFDGNPAYPSLDRLWGLAEEIEVTSFGASAGYFAACRNEGLHPGREHDLSRLNAVGSTGSPLDPADFRWIYDSVGKNIWLYSTSGGTDVCTPFVGGSPILPVYPGELQCRQLGVLAEAWNEDGEAVVDEVGELVVTEPMPSMPLGFWGDDGARYRSAYFEQFPGVWRHGDWIRFTADGGSVILGRSDATINRNGVRMGTAEIYRAVLSVPAVEDALVVDLPGENGLWMPLFVVLPEGEILDEEREAEIKRAVRHHCSARHVPDAVIQVEELPRTLSGKLLELPVKKILQGATPDEVVSRESLANPRALDWFAEARLILMSAAEE